MIPNEKYSIFKIDANQSIDKVYTSVIGVLKDIYS